MIHSSKEGSRVRRMDVLFTGSFAVLRMTGLLAHFFPADPRDLPQIHTAVVADGLPLHVGKQGCDGDGHIGEHENREGKRV